MRRSYKIILILLILAAMLVAPVSACKKEKIHEFKEINTFEDIDGITDHEKEAIKKIKSKFVELSFGSLESILSFKDSDETLKGFSVSFCGRLESLFGIKFKLQNFEWEELKAKLDDETLDFTGVMTPTEERKKENDGSYFMTYPIAEHSLQIYTTEKFSSAIRTESDLNGRKIGFLKDSTTEATVKNFYSSLEFKTIPVENYQEAKELLINEKIDAFICEEISNYAFTDFYAIDFFPMVFSPVSLTTANSDLAPIISVVNKYIVAGGSDELYKMYKEGELEYKRYKFRNAVEKLGISEYLEKFKKEPILIGVEHDNYPVTFWNKNEKKFQGMAIDILEEITEITGIQFKPDSDENTTFKEIYTKLKTGDIKMATQVLYEDDRAKYVIWTETPYGKAYYTLLSRSNEENLASYQVRYKKVGIMEGSAKEQIYTKHFPENDNKEYFDTQIDALKALEKGKIDLFVASEYTLLFASNFLEMSGFKTNITLSTPMNSNFGFNKEEKELRDIIEEAQNFVKTADIERKWMGMSFDYEKKLAEMRVVNMTIFLSILAFVLCIAVLLLLLNMRLSEKLKKIANKDALTGIFNRRHFMELGVAIFERSMRKKDNSFCIIFDLDHFKKVNDTFGHLAGDKVLCEIAKRVKNSIRPYDLFGRYGGEEFIMIMPDLDKDSVMKACERIRLEICETPVEFEDIKIQVSASFGVCIFSKCKNLGEATKLADEALYAAKQQGRNRVVFYGRDSD